MTKSFQEMFWKAGGMKRPIAKLKSLREIGSARCGIGRAHGLDTMEIERYKKRTPLTN